MDTRCKLINSKHAVSSDNASKSPIPVLTDVVPEETSRDAGVAALSQDTETLIAELQTQLSAHAFALAERILHSAFTELEADLREQITVRLRQELPELIDKILREHLYADEDP